MIGCNEDKVGVNEAVTRVFGIENCGKIKWRPGSTLQPIRSDIEAEPVPLPELDPGDQTNVEIQLKAPSKPGLYHTYWRLTGPKGRKFGKKI